MTEAPVKNEMQLSSGWAYTDGNETTSADAAARLVFNTPKFSYTTPPPRIKFKSLTLPLKAKNGLASPYLSALIKSVKHSLS